MKASITITFDTDSLQGYTDQHLAALWHVAQANPEDGFQSREPGELAEKIGREIIRRFLTQTPPALWEHQGRHFDSGRVMEMRTPQVVEALQDPTYKPA
jgi:hypothetical protein